MRQGQQQQQQYRGRATKRLNNNNKIINYELSNIVLDLSASSTHYQAEIILRPSKNSQIPYRSLVCVYPSLLTV